jgi:predicted O-linked N-acetylglucosamine transferase (SPINDLY family)
MLPPDPTIVPLLRRAFESYQAGQLAEAERVYRDILARDPRNFPALNMLGVIAAQRRDYDGAIGHLTRASRANPSAIEVHINLGRIQAECRDYPAAVASLARALAINPRHPLANNNYGATLSQLKRMEEALLHLQRATAAAPDYFDAWHNQGNVLSEMRRFKEAFIAYDTAFRLNPAAEETEGARLFAKLQICDWSNFETERSRLVAAIRSGRFAAPPLKMLRLTADPAEQLQCARIYAARRHGGVASAPFAPRAARDRIRVAYVSYDFRPHPVARLIAGVVEAHDRSRFEVIGVSLQEDDRSEIGQRLKHGFDKFIDVSKLDDAALLRLLREQEFDVAVDLMGYTNGNRANAFALRIAPIQVAYLGFLGTLGAAHIDYMIADRVVVPETHRQYFTEKIAYLPSYLVSDRNKMPAQGQETRSDFGLPDHAIVFCCFNNSYKISPATFDSWMRILHRVESAVLWLHAENDEVVHNLKHAAVARGVDASRLVFAKPAPYQHYLARYRLADLVLDTHPQNAGGTASDALKEGIPLLTRLGQTMAGRIAASALTAVGLPELITHTSTAYEDRAVELVTDREKLQTLKQKLAHNRRTMPLFDTEAFTRHIEAAYSLMIERHRAGVPPDHIQVLNSADHA